MSYGENVCVTEMLFKSIVLLTVSSMLMNHQHILNKVYLNRNPHKTSSLVDETVVTTCLQESNPVFPRGAMIQYVLYQ